MLVSEAEMTAMEYLVRQNSGGTGYGWSECCARAGVLLESCFYCSALVSRVRHILQLLIRWCVGQRVDLVIDTIHGSGGIVL